MNKTFTSIILISLLNLTFFLKHSYGQIVVNTGFENWSIGASGFLEPNGWTTTNGVLPSSVVQSVGRTGNYSVKVKSVPNGSGGVDGGFADQYFTPPVGIYPTLLTGYWKANTSNGFDQMSICVYVYDSNGTYLNDFCVYTPLFTNISNWTPFSIGISGGTYGGYYLISLLFGNLSTLTSTYGEVDDLSLNVITSTGEQVLKLTDNYYISTVDPFNIYKLNIDLLKSTDIIIDIIDINGHLIQSSKNNFSFGHHESEISLAGLSSGLYLCRVSDGKTQKQFKLIKT